MRHFSGLSDDTRDALFQVAPSAFDATTDRALLATALGATLYTPGTRRDYAARLPDLVRCGLTSGVLCLEDAIADADVDAAETNVVEQLTQIHHETEEPPLLFVRVRRPDQVLDIADRLGDATRVLAGFVLPKFTEASGAAYLDAVKAVGTVGMPVLESEELVALGSRTAELLAVRDLVQAHDERVLAIRIGGTDMCGLFGLRRSPDLTIWDIAVIRDVIAAIVNVMGLAGYVVTGPVWEYFADTERMLKPLLRQGPFDERGVSDLRARLLRRDLDGLLREVMLDRANGLTGKTVIHPTHVAAVHALAAVTHDEWVDAQAVLGSAGGAVGSGGGMVEAKPHARWAAAVVRRATVFGVLREDLTFVDLLGAAA